MKDQYGFRFWLSWILWFAGSFVLTALFWTALITFTLGKIRGYELTITWSASVFGSWFILLTPFMRKKEQIWKRLNQDQEKAVNIWLMGMGLFVGFLVFSAFFWSFWFKKEITSPAHHGLSNSWAKAVFGSWLLSLLPLLSFLYKRTDQILKSAIARQTQMGPKFQTQFIEKTKRTLSPRLASKLSEIPETLPKAHVVDLILKNGQRIPHVFIMNKNEVLGVYNREKIDFEFSEAADLEPVSNLPHFEEEKWLRLDGRA